ncbi:hypothetical protein PoB_004932400 [Plakobranchus ocellatus]|uniref:Uncharacterized protein n=1 Tax=Plakobranchus ocellatus TaxID=259542 RepID=A0AAV4BRL8_9GAST|nr:hypothetical protein PoB_004932400 [Plakobranchus ocellatus]
MHLQNDAFFTRQRQQQQKMVQNTRKMCRKQTRMQRFSTDAVSVLLALQKLQTQKSFDSLSLRIVALSKMHGGSYECLRGIVALEDLKKLILLLSGGTGVSESALRSIGTLLSRFRAPPPAS